jgi:hypothetical protein
MLCTACSSGVAVCVCTAVSGVNRSFDVACFSAHSQSRAVVLRTSSSAAPVCLSVSALCGVTARSSTTYNCILAHCLLHLAVSPTACCRRGRCCGGSTTSRCWPRRCGTPWRARTSRSSTRCLRGEEPPPVPSKRGVVSAWFAWNWTGVLACGTSFTALCDLHSVAGASDRERYPCWWRCAV